MNSTWKGIFAGLLAGAFWGLSFLFPRMLVEFSSNHIATGRFFFFGLFSILTFISLSSRKKIDFLFRYWRQGLLFSITGYSLYYFMLVEAIQLTGIQVSSLIIGLLPVTIALGSRNRVRSKKVFNLALLMIALGMLILNQKAFQTKTTSRFGVLLFY